MHGMLFERNYRVRVGTRFAIRLRSASGDGYTSALLRGATAPFVLEPRRERVSFPSHEHGVLTLKELQEHRDELRIQIDVRSGSEPWREISDWSEVAITPSHTP